MAFVTFLPAGTQLDNDEIVDLQVNEGDSLGAIFTLDTSGLDADLRSIKLQLEGDSTEINLSDTLTNLFGTTFPDVAVVESNSDGDFVSLVVELRGEPGAAPNTANILVETEATILDGLVNDGATDVGVTVIEAIDANGNDVTDLFEPTSQAIDLQPSPQVQEILGTEKSDPIIGTPQNDLIKGKEGDDFIIDNEGNDTVFGDEGNDLFFNGAGDDIILGGAGDDFVSGVGNGFISGIDSDSGDDDIIDLGTGNNAASGGAGADTFVLNRNSGITGIGDFTPGEDRFALGENLTKDDLNFAQLDNDSLGVFGGSTLINDAHTGKLIAIVSFASVEAVSNAEFVNVEEVLPTDNSSLVVDESIESIQVELPEAQSGEIFGTPNLDILVGDDETNLILAGGGNDFANAGAGDDLVFGDDGEDILNGEAGQDLLNGGADGDVLNGGEGDDILLGEIGNDILDGNDGNDTLVGGSENDIMGSGPGDDLLFGGGGNDALFGNEGSDTFAFGSGEEADIIFDFELGQDAIALDAGSSYDSLQIEYNAEGNYTNVSDETGELITTLIGVEADQLTESDFTAEGQTEVTIDADLDSESAEPAEPAIPLEDGVTNVSFDTEFLASEAGLTFSEAEDTVEPTSEEFDLGFDITEESDFVFSEANGFTPLGGTIEHTGTVTFESGAGDVTVGDVSVSYDESRVSDTTSGLFVSNNVEGVIPEEAVLFDVGTFDGSILNIGKADLLIANEFADIFARNRTCQQRFNRC